MSHNHTSEKVRHVKGNSAKCYAAETCVWVVGFGCVRNQKLQFNCQGVSVSFLFLSFFSRYFSKIVLISLYSSWVSEINIVEFMYAEGSV